MSVGAGAYVGKVTEFLANQPSQISIAKRKPLKHSVNDLLGVRCVRLWTYL